LKKTGTLVKPIRRKRESPILTQQMPSTFHPRAMANTQPQLHPALLRLSAMISQYFNASDV
jgi:hypothetical protein